MSVHYSSNLSDQERILIKSLTLSDKLGDQPQKVNILAIMNATFYMVQAGSQ